MSMTQILPPKEFTAGVCVVPVIVRLRFTDCAHITFYVPNSYSARQIRSNLQDNDSAEPPNIRCAADSE